MLLTHTATSVTMQDVEMLVVSHVLVAYAIPGFESYSNSWPHKCVQNITSNTTLQTAITPVYVCLIR